MSELGIEFISVFGMPPVEFVELAAELGCPNISLGLSQMEYNPHDYPRYSLIEDAALRREIKAALAANGVTISLGENLPVQPGVDSRDEWRASLDVLSEFGVRRINSVSFEADPGRNVEQYGLLAEVTAEYGVAPLIEFVPIFGIPDLPTALEVIRQVDRPNLGLIVDTMHVGRTGASTDALRAIPPELVGYVQLCDAPLRSDRDYMDEAMHERMAPGEGELPLADYLRALPRDRIVSLEIPQRSLADAGVGPRERLGNCVSRARELLRTLD